MRKVLSILVMVLMASSLVMYCFLGINLQEDANVEILRVYNWEEYISEGTEEVEDENGNITEVDIDVISMFETYCREELGRNVKVEYSTFGTNENMYNELNLSKKQTANGVEYSYDLVAPSEYMLLKMMREGMLEKYDKTALPNYYENASGYIQNLFENLTVEDKNGTVYTLSDYATCYMWGTMGFVYNPELVLEEDASSWSLLWNDKYKGQGTIKDSVRDSYIMAIGYIYKEELDALYNSYQNNEIGTEEYNAELTEIFNRTDSESISKTGVALTELKDKIYGYEVDSGKKEMAAGKISINFCWSGDGVYTMDIAEEEDGLILNYALPEEGSNIFFDGWAMPKGANVELARQFANFLARPEIARLNMGFIGYTSAIASDTMFENAVDWYGYTQEDVTKVGEQYFVENEDGEQVEVFPIDLSYFFDNLKEYDNAVIYTEELGRQFSAQYPDKATVDRCTVMKCFTDEETKQLNNMWETAKVGKTNDVAMLIVVLIIILAIVLAVVFYNLYRKGKLFQPKAPEGYTITKIEKIN